MLMPQTWATHGPLLLIDHLLCPSNSVMKLLNCVSWQYLVDMNHKNTKTVGTTFMLVIRYYNPLGLVISICRNIFNL